MTPYGGVDQPVLTAGFPGSKGSRMRKHWYIVAFTCAAAALPPASALAASQTVQGTGDIDKMVANNAQSALKVSLFGLDAPCDAKYMKITVDWGTKAGYAIENGCYPGGTWDHSLVYLPDRSAGDGGKIIKCPKLRFSWDEDAETHRAKVPRSCIPKAGNKLRVRAEGLNFSSVTGGEAGPTKRLRRG
jgi:hypothetical protein